MLLKVSFFFVADPCHHYSNLSEANRNTKTETKEVLCDSQLRKGWYRFVGAAGTRMPTERVQAFRCGTNWPGWLTTTHPTVEDGEVRGMVCFNDRSTGCQYSKKIFVKNMWILLHLQFFSASKQWFALLWYGLNVEQKIQEIRGVIDPQVHVLQGFCFYGFYTMLMSC